MGGECGRRGARNAIDVVGAAASDAAARTGIRVLGCREAEGFPDPQGREGMDARMTGADLARMDAGGPGPAQPE